MISFYLFRPENILNIYLDNIYLFPRKIKRHFNFHLCPRNNLRAPKCAQQSITHVVRAPIWVICYRSGDKKCGEGQIYDFTQSTFWTFLKNNVALHIIFPKIAPPINLFRRPLKLSGRSFARKWESYIFFCFVRKVIRKAQSLHCQIGKIIYAARSEHLVQKIRTSKRTKT